MSVYLTLQKSVCDSSKKQDKTVAIQKCGNPPYEISLRFAGCNLRCGACFASGYSWPGKYLNSRRVTNDVPLARLIEDYNNIPKGRKSYNWVRILGGEPLLNEEHVNYLFVFIEQLAKTDTRFFNHGIVIQTNGIYLGQSDNKLIEHYLNKLSEINPRLKIAIEVSIKGTNPAEFSLLSQSSQEMFHANLKAYMNLKKIKTNNLRPTIIAGFGISESLLLEEGRSNRSMMTILSDPDTPAYHPDVWANEFRTLYEQFTTDWKKKNVIFQKMPMYGIKDEFNYNWVKFALKQAKEVYGSKFYDSDYSVHSDILEKKMRDMLKYFFLLENQKYYTELIS